MKRNPGGRVLAIALVGSVAFTAGACGGGTASKLKNLADGTAAKGKMLVPVGRSVADARR